MQETQPRSLVSGVRFDPGSIVYQSSMTLDELLIQEALCASVAQYVKRGQKNIYLVGNTEVMFIL